MANSSNVYATAQPLQGNISNWLLSQEEMGMRQQAEKRRQEELDYIKQQKQQEKEDKLRERLLGKIPKNYDTGSSSLNEFQAGIIKEGANRLGEIYLRLKDPNLSEAEKTRLEIEAQNIGNLPENLKLSTDNFTKLIGDYKTGVEGGSMWQNPDFEKKVLNGFENYVGGLDENGLPIVGFVDKDGDGKMDVMGYENLSQGIGVWEFQPKLDYDKMIKTTADTLGTVEEGKPLPGYQNRVTKGIPLTVAQDRAKALIQDANGNLTNFAKSTFRQYGIDYNNPSPTDIANLEKQVTQDIIMSKDSSDVTKKNYSAAVSAQREARLSKDEKDANPIAFVEKTPSSTTFAIKEPVVFQSKNKNNQPGTATNISMDKNGNISVTASILKGKKSVKSYDGDDNEITTSEDVYEEKILKTKEEVMPIIAELLGVDSYGQAQQVLKQQSDQYKTTDDLPNLDELPDF